MGNEETLSESKALYRTIFENTGTATIIGEDNTTIYLANAQFQNLSGYSKKELEGKKSWTCFRCVKLFTKIEGFSYEVVALL
jgi:PAS domain S-box-containing protein